MTVFDLIEELKTIEDPENIDVKVLASFPEIDLLYEEFTLVLQNGVFTIHATS